MPSHNRARALSQMSPAAASFTCLQTQTRIRRQSWPRQRNARPTGSARSDSRFKCGSCGVCQGVPVLDLEYEEDSNAEADANFVLTGAGDIVEIQATGEKRGFTRAEFEALFGLAEKGIGELFALQRAAAAA